jgi:hypothetical protein
MWSSYRNCPQNLFEMSRNLRIRMQYVHLNHIKYYIKDNIVLLQYTNSIQNIPVIFNQKIVCVFDIQKY